MLECDYILHVKNDARRMDVLEEVRAVVNMTEGNLFVIVNYHSSKTTISSSSFRIHHILWSWTIQRLMFPVPPEFKPSNNRSMV